MDYLSLTPMMKQYIEIKKKYPEGILLFRAGDFYEMFYDDAKVASKILNITLTKRGKGDKQAPLAGIPYHSIDPYITKLIKAGKKVVICEQIEDPKKAKGVVKRDVVRIITPSTQFTENYDNNFLCSISKTKYSFGFAFVDITTGEFKTSILDSLTDILNELSLIKPKEIILSKNLLKTPNYINSIKKTVPNTIINYSENSSYEISYNYLKKHFNLKNLENFGLEDKEELIIACYNALKYLKETQFTDLSYINNISQYSLKKYLKLDRKTIRNLELVSNLRYNTVKDSLFYLINKTKTAMGYRKLYFDILHPKTNKDELNDILDSVSELIENLFLQEELKNHLSYIGDLDRIISKIGFGNANARDLVSLRTSLSVIIKIKDTLKNVKTKKLRNISNNLINLIELNKLLKSSIVDDPPFSVRESNIIKENYSNELDELININKSMKSWLIEYESKLRLETNLKSLKVKFNKVFGYYIEVPKSQKNQVPDYFERRQTLVNSERYTTKELTEKENKIIFAKERRAELEYNLFLNICKQVMEYQKEIHLISNLISELDVYLSHAQVSSMYNYQRPVLNNDTLIYFKDLRHPIIEQKIEYIPNDFNLSSENRTMIITGPNMAGKSSYMRAISLSLILGLIGCFVPASEAQIGKIDGIFTRVGSSDDIVHGQSTFLQEMSEVAYILNYVTKDSFVILDEVGRGTSTYDGISLAWAIIEFLNNFIGCKTLVATHYHMLNKMQDMYSGIKNYHILAKEEGDNLFFYHKLKEGGINKSYGIHVAKMAGINEKIINRAKDIQKELEEDAFLKTNNPQKNKEPKRVLYKKEQKALFDF